MLDIENIYIGEPDSESNSNLWVESKIRSLRGSSLTQGSSGQECPYQLKDFAKRAAYILVFWLYLSEKSGVGGPSDRTIIFMPSWIFPVSVPGRQGPVALWMIVGGWQKPKSSG